MKVRNLTLGGLGVAVLVLAFVGGQRAASQDFENPSAEPIPVGRTPAYLAFNFPTATADYTVENPRAADGKVFYITETFGCNYSFPAYLYIPELNSSTMRPIIVPAMGHQSFNTPIPFVTTMEVNSSSTGGIHLVLAGYWSTRQPDIEVIEIE